MTEEEGDLTLEIAQIGDDADRFLSSPLGRWIETRLDDEIERYRDELESLDIHYDAERQHRIRTEIKVRRLIKIYIAEAYESGQAAITELESRGYQ